MLQVRLLHVNFDDVSQTNKVQLMIFTRRFATLPRLLSIYAQSYMFLSLIR